MKKFVPLLLFVFILLLAACSSPTPAPPATIDPTQVADSVNATLTAQAPTPEPAPTATPEPTATRVPIEGDPATVLGEPDGADTFNTANNWTLFDNQCFKSTIVDGKYVMESKGLEGAACWEVSWPNIHNFYMESEVYMPEQCQADDRFGLFFRAPDNFRGYLYGLTCDGRYTLTKWDGQETTVIVPPASNEAINVGPGAVNRIGVVAYGGEYLLYANGVYLAEGQDFSYNGNGKIGYYVRASSDQGFVVEYDNLKVWLLDDQYYPPTDPTPPQTGVVPTPEPGAPTVTTITYVNVRSGPGLNYPIYFVAAPGTTAEAVGISSDGAWYAIKIPTSVSGTGTGWISASYVIPQNTENLSVLSPPPLPPEAGFPPPEGTVPTVTNFEPINVRSGPGTQFPSYGVAPTGSTAPVIGINAEGTWYAVRIPTTYSPDGTGWVNANYVVLSNPAGVDIPVITSPEELPPVEHPPPAEGVPFVTSTDVVNARSGPDTICASYGVSTVGATAEVLGISADGKWYMVVLPTTISPDGTGWANANYLILTNPAGVEIPVRESQICP